MPRWLALHFATFWLKVAGLLWKMLAVRNQWYRETRLRGMAQLFSFCSSLIAMLGAWCSCMSGHGGYGHSVSAVTERACVQDIYGQEP